MDGVFLSSRVGMAAKCNRSQNTVVSASLFAECEYIYTHTLAYTYIYIYIRSHLGSRHRLHFAAMPTRENKKTPSTTWAVFFASNELAPGGKRNIQQACRASNGRVQVETAYVRSLVLRWHKAVKFDQANAFATKYSKLTTRIAKVQTIGEGLPNLPQHQLVQLVRECQLFQLPAAYFRRHRVVPVRLLTIVLLLLLWG